jgi:hypothetical protein
MALTMGAMTERPALAAPHDAADDLLALVDPDRR